MRAALVVYAVDVFALEMSDDNPTMIDPKVATTLLKGDINNLARKVKSEKPLSKGERELLMSAIDTTSNRENADTYAKNQTELAEILGVERKTVQRWLKSHPELKKKPYKWPDGRYRVADWRIWRQKSAGIKSEDGLSPAQLKARQILLQNEKLEIQNGILKKQYSLNSDVERWAADMVSAAKKILLSMPSVLAPQVVGLSVPDAEERLKDTINDALEQLHTQPWQK